MLRKSPIYECGSIILPDGRVLVTSLGGKFLGPTFRSALSLEIYVTPDSEILPMDSLCTEISHQLGMTTQEITDMELFNESEAMSVFNKTFVRHIRMFVFKINKLCNFRIKTSRRMPLQFLTLNEISSMIHNKKIDLSACGNEMFKNLKSLNI